MKYSKFYKELIVVTILFLIAAILFAIINFIDLSAACAVIFLFLLSCCLIIDDESKYDLEL
jgi:hypothetical protein